MRVYARARGTDGRVMRLTVGDERGGAGNGAPGDRSEPRPSPRSDAASQARGRWWLLRALEQEDYERHF